jgi:transcriptional regulator with XRE-family HTH domain
MSEQAPTVGELFAVRVREVRERRGWKQDYLGRRLLELEGERTSPTKVNSARVRVARTEAGTRAVVVDEAFLFAAALGVSPLALLLPDEPEATVAVGSRSMDAGLLEAWIAGYVALDARDVRDYTDHARPLPPSRYLNRLIGEVLELDEAPSSSAVRAILRAYVAMRLHDLAVEERGLSDVQEPTLRVEMQHQVNIRRTMIEDLRRVLDRTDEESR